ncbi:class I SAM-dependent rRNA methyltransferase [Imperialibacter roseus]|uniref:Class I SAM-dependent rRNA methyltransferase n=1 Tax=Imperialibacter roseus TaxID=1324217 RepID=A0ABZ0IKQ6_9BACT|nr:class I SAM-dependent rRNA methyltransferase [Imperialibacter roseus]WOK05112.1 class I SAM-dependent rRNA methyltransferase [Imperialibacter roseus]|tara:strand:+ start:12498 stop:13682 length:1185 start_codon:yes stop_codon:yes gene_type:complete
MSSYPTIVLKAGKERSIQRFHPWVFSGAIQHTPKGLNEGDLVQVLDSRKKFLGIGHYQIGSITVRMVAFSDVTVDQAFWKGKIDRAVEARRAVGLTKKGDLNVFRLIHGEGDGLPGLIMDYYNGTVVFQAHSVGMYLLKDTFASILKELDLPITACYNKSAGTIPFKAPIQAEDGFIFGEGDTIEVNEYGSKFTINVVEGQKTGFFIDQRESRRLLEEFSKGRKVLNTFCYTGGFSVSALKAGASEVVSVDSSQKAIDLTEQIIDLNFGKTEKHTSLCADAFDYLAKMPDDFDVIVLDPPAFAKHVRVLENGLKGYRTINEKAIKKIKPGGILFTFSCSQVVSPQDFRTAVFSAAAATGREVRILYQVHQPADHPVSIYHPEGEYLKGLVLQIS